MNIKLIAIDIDGTLLNPDDLLTDGTKQAIQEALDQGIKVVLCTGRPLSGAMPYLKALNISGDQQYAITFNGAMAQNADGKVISHFTLTHDDFMDTELLARKLGVNFQFENTESIYALNRDISSYSVYEANLVNLPIKYRAPEEITKDITITKTMFIAEPEKITAIKEQIPQEIHDRMYVVQTTPVFLEMMNKKASKGNTLTELAKQLNLDINENVMAIGDQGNDVSMIKAAGLGVAMGNGIDEVKAVANQITKPNSEDGVAYAIRQWALK